MTMMIIIYYSMSVDYDDVAANDSADDDDDGNDAGGTGDGDDDEDDEDDKDDDDNPHRTRVFSSFGNSFSAA